MPVCPTCKVRHAPYSCAQYEQLRRAENAADDARSEERHAAAAEQDRVIQHRRLRRLLRRRPRSI